MEALSRLEEDSRGKGYTDWQTGFWKAFLLTLITFGIYGIYVLYKLLERREQHFERMVSFRGNLIAVLEEQARTGGGVIEADIAELRRMDAEAAGRDRRGEKSPVLWLVLGILTGVTNFYVYYFLNDDFRAHEENEQRFLEKAGAVMTEAGRDWSPPPLHGPVPERNLILYLVLTLVTLGLFAVYWWYTLITDANHHFDYHLLWEPRLVSAVASE